MKRYLFLTILQLVLIHFLLIAQKDVIQEKNKIDSTFKFYFKVIEIELYDKNKCNYSQLYFKEYDPVSNDTICFSKFSFEAIDFFERLSGINAPVKQNNQSVKYLSNEIFCEWKKWYNVNKARFKLESGMIIMDQLIIWINEIPQAERRIIQKLPDKEI